jgi:membrane-associated phospholipid phosphatase
MRSRLVVLLGAACLVTVYSVVAHAQPAPAPRHGVYWKDEWPRFTVLEAMISAAVTARNADLGAHLDGPLSATIEFEVPVLDHGARDLLVAGSAHRRAAYARLTDLGTRTLVFAPYVFDAGIAALAIHRNYDVAAQLALIDFEVLTLAGMTQLLGSRVIGRARPYVQNCPTPEECTGGPYRGFLSGHAMASFTGAGLMCVHHEMLPLFGGGAPDTWACVWAVSLATLTSISRVAADEHWASDVLIGAGAGWLYGYYLPKLLHFHAAKVTKTADGRPRDVTWFPSLTGTSSSGVLGVMGMF